MRQQASDRNISIHIEGEPLELSGDRGKIKQVLLNLLTNAIKYNKDHGEIFITVVQTQDNGRRLARIAVRDTGKGISPENQANMFQRFFRTADTEGYAQGTGLGLAIAKRIIEAHGGNMWLESELGVGTTFFFTLSVAP